MAHRGPDRETSMYRYLSVMAAAAALSMVMAGTPARSQTQCGEFSGAAFGLCNAYCEAMACGSDNPQATDNACMKVKSKFDVITSSAPLPCIATGNTAPTLDLDFNTEGTGATATFVSFGDAVPIAVNVEITDDGDTITSATVTLTDPVPDAPYETLSLSPAGHDLLADIGGTIDDEDPTALVITGMGTLAQYAAILQQVVYDNALGAPDTSLRTVDVTVSDGTAPPSNTAVAAVTVEHGCPCSSFTNDSIVTTGLVGAFAPTEGVVGPGEEWGWSNVSCQVLVDTNGGARLAVRSEFLVGGVVVRSWGFGSDPGECRSVVTAESDNVIWFQRVGEGSPTFRPNEEILDYTTEMDEACRTRIPIQIDRLRATFAAGGVDVNTVACTPPTF